jgi:hypothetical protein
MGLVGDRAALPVGSREALPAGDRLPASSQGKNVNVLLVRGDGIYGSSPPYIFSRENCEPVIGKKSWDFRAIAKHSLRAIISPHLLKGKL